MKRTKCVNCKGVGYFERYNIRKGIIDRTTCPQCRGMRWVKQQKGSAV